MLNVLVIDDPSGPSLYNKVSYTDFVSLRDDNVSLLIISGTDTVSDSDKEKSLRWKELKSPTTNGLVEVVAQRWHRELLADGKGGIHQIYTKQEDLILRVARLRELLCITSGLLPDAAECFRDKVKMKQVASSAGFPVPAFKRVFSPSCILSFVEEHGLPVVVKPSLGSASAAVVVVRDEATLLNYLERTFFDGLDSAGRRMDFAGDVIIEKFVPGTMYHVNGYARGGIVEYVWPFQYLQTNLEFAAGKAYGNVLIAKSDTRHARLLCATQRLLAILPCPTNLVFHLEFFSVGDDFYLCEIAARRPGGSIGCLIDLYEASNAPEDFSLNKSLFHELEFRCNLGLPSRFSVRGNVKTDSETDQIVGDLIIPHRVGVLRYLPNASERVPFNGVKYCPVGKIGTVYRGFDINVMNTAARLVAEQHVTQNSEPRVVNGSYVKETLDKALQWFSERAIYDDIVAEASTLNKDASEAMIALKNAIAPKSEPQSTARAYQPAAL